jgi:hypothetical protein
MNAKVRIQDLNNQALVSRMNGLALSLYYDNAQLMLPADIADLFRETVDECNRRGLDQVQVVPTCIEQNDLPPKVYRRQLVRYDKRDRLERLMQGFISFGPACLYKDATIEAQRDDESQRRELGANQIVTIKDVKYPASDIGFYTNVSRPDGTPIPYHLFCAASEESQKLRRAFHADGFVRINNYAQFLELLEGALERDFPNVCILAGHVRYYDDRQGHNSKTLEDIIFCKTIDYIYQREFRIALLGAPDSARRFEVQIPMAEGLLNLAL